MLEIGPNLSNLLQAVLSVVFTVAMLTLFTILVIKSRKS